MKREFIAVLDSGIGGISLLRELIKVMPNENYLYFGDNDNAPYGSKNIRTLKAITEKNIDLIKRYDIKVLALGCNTLSVNLLNDIENYSGIKTFGVFPPVERAVLNGKTLLLATERTAERYKKIPNLLSVGLKDLAGDIERNAFSLNKVNFERHLNSVGLDVKNIKDYKTVILGCTHYNFIKNKISAHLKPLKILSGEFFTAKQVEKFLITTKSLVIHKRNQLLFVGENHKQNRLFFEKSGQNLLN